ncbi:MAG: glycosyltransferase [Chitinispirillaceae bacterium]
MGYTVLNVGYPFAPVCPDTAGGAEQVLLTLDEYLHSNGHRSVVLACKESRVHGELRENPVPDGVIDDLSRLNVEKEYRSIIETLVGEESVDLVHFHGIDSERYLPNVSVPVLITLHLPVSWYSSHIYNLNRPCTYFNCVSYNQLSTCRDLPNMLGVVENGVGIPEFPGKSVRGRYAVSMGRVCPEKGFHLAMDAARKAGVSILLAGKVYPYREHLDYFSEEILPRLDRNKCTFLGPVGPGRKYKVLSRACCTLVSSSAPETSSLVAMESFACGTPVITFPSGALPEIVDHGKTGFVVNSPEQMAEAIQFVSSLDRRDCWLAARKRFSAQRMCRQYMKLYNSILNYSCGEKVNLAG